RTSGAFRLSGMSCSTGRSKMGSPSLACCTPLRTSTTCLMLNVSGDRVPRTPSFIGIAPVPWLSYDSHLKSADASRRGFGGRKNRRVPFRASNNTSRKGGFSAEFEPRTGVKFHALSVATDRQISVLGPSKVVIDKGGYLSIGSVRQASPDVVLEQTDGETF